MKIKDLVKECQERYNQALCQTCPYRYKECEKARQLYFTSSPSHYEILLEAEV